MDWILSVSKQDSILSPQQPQPTGLNLNNKVSPSILIIIIIIAIIFFISGLLHLLVRFLLRQPQNRHPQDWEDNNVTAFQGQLQQLFHLHDSGVDQSYIDNLPIFTYKSIVGAKKDPFDCAVCLCEFEEEDDLRLLPQCSHAFHMECIDTWLLSNSTCPLCRASLLSDIDLPSSPLVLVLESGISESSNFSDGNGNTHLGSCRRGEFGSTRIDFSRKSCEIEENGDGNQETVEGFKEKTVLVKLGNFRNLDCVDGEGVGTISESSDNKVDSRRCFSMGSFAYVMDESLSLQVPLKKSSVKKRVNRPAMSECGNDSRRDFNGFEVPFRKSELLEIGTVDANSSEIGRRVQKESFSISKIWLRGKKNKGKQPGPTETESGGSFRFPVYRSVAAVSKSGEIDGGSSVSEVNFGSELGYDEESQRWNSLSNEPKTPSFARRTLLWLVGKQNKVVHSSFSSNI